MDVSQPEQINDMVQNTMSAFGRTDWLESVDMARDIQAQITVDLLGVI